MPRCFHAPLPTRTTLCRKWNHRPTKKEARCSRHLDSTSAFWTWWVPTTVSIVITMMNRKPGQTPLDGASNLMPLDNPHVSSPTVTKNASRFWHALALGVSIALIMANFSSFSGSMRLNQTETMGNIPISYLSRVLHQTVKASADRKKEFLFLAFYYPWYVAGTDRWSQYGQDIHPLLGQYGSDQISVAERHIDMAVRGGIDCFVVSWGKQVSKPASNILNATLKASNIDKIKFTMLYESKSALPADGDFANGAMDKFVSDMIFFRETYFDHPSYTWQDTGKTLKKRCSRQSTTK